jgi:hypothetical protein
LKFLLLYASESAEKMTSGNIAHHNSAVKSCLKEIIEILNIKL